MKNKINMEKLQIKLCTVNNIEHIYKIQNIVINNFKKVKKAFLTFKYESYLWIVNDPINDGKIYGTFLDGEMIAWGFFISFWQNARNKKSYS